LKTPPKRYLFNPPIKFYNLGKNIWPLNYGAFPAQVSK
jgi:hypothetical protein